MLLAVSRPRGDGDGEYLARSRTLSPRVCARVTLTPQARPPR